MRIAIVAPADSMVDMTLRKLVGPELAKRGLDVGLVRNLEGANLNEVDVLVATTLTKKALQGIKSAYPNLITVVADPKLLTKQEIELVKLADFSLVGSREHEAQVVKYGGSVATMYWRPQLGVLEESPTTFKGNCGKLRLFYHGSRAHLESFSRTSLHEIELLAAKYDIVLEAHYSKRRLGQWKPPRWVRNLEIEHWDWKEPIVWERLSGSDIGIVPNLLPARTWRPLVQRRTRFNSWMNPMVMRRDDYLLRFKVTSNPGRLLPYAHFGKPVIADFFPSSADFVRDGIDGFVPLNNAQWRSGLQTLISSESARRSMGLSFQKRFASIGNTEILVDRFLTKLASIGREKGLDPVPWLT
jgi:hypothetical protein